MRDSLIEAEPTEWLDEGQSGGADRVDRCGTEWGIDAGQTGTDLGEGLDTVQTGGSDRGVSRTDQDRPGGWFGRGTDRGVRRALEEDEAAFRKTPVS